MGFCGRESSKLMGAAVRQDIILEKEKIEEFKRTLERTGD